jgi:hypothetical protein
VLPFVQQMCAERNDAIARLEMAHDRSGFVTEAGDVHGAPGHPGRFSFYQPHAGPLALIEDRTNRYL